MTGLARFKSLLLLFVFVPALLISGCSDDPTPAVKDSSVVDQNPFQNDLPVQQGDSYVWPDTTNPSDMWVWPDLYSGTPFGCQSDADCFGRQCCATPWGVKVCADSCSP